MCLRFSPNGEQRVPTGCCKPPADSTSPARHLGELLTIRVLLESMLLWHVHIYIYIYLYICIEGPESFVRVYINIHMCRYLSISTRILICG